MKKTLLLSCLGMACLMLLSGCATLPGGVAPSNTPIEGRSYSQLRTVAETSSRVYLLQIIPVTRGNTTRSAINSAIRKQGGDAMIDITVDYYAQNWILFSRYITKVEGTVIRFSR